MVVAYLNIQIPQLLGGIIDVVSKHSNEIAIIGSGDMASGSFFKDMKAPALHLLSMYGAQVKINFIYNGLNNNNISNNTNCPYPIYAVILHVYVHLSVIWNR